MSQKHALAFGYAWQAVRRSGRTGQVEKVDDGDERL
jgi:hypothetical protein